MPFWWKAQLPPSSPSFKTALMNDPWEPRQALNDHIAPWVRNTECSLLFLHLHAIWTDWVNAVSFGTVLLFHCSNPRNAHTLWPFNRPRCWTGASLYFTSLTGDTVWLQPVPRASGCMTAQYLKSATSQAGWPTVCKRDGLCLLPTYHHDNFPL